MEYARYSSSPTGYIQREGADHDWEICSTQEASEAQQALTAEKEAGQAALKSAGGVVLQGGMRSSKARLDELDQ